MTKLKLTFACDDYYHTRALADGRVAVEGADLTYLKCFPAETFPRMLRTQEFDACEMGLKFFISSLDLDDPPLVAVPVFPARNFRHSAIYVSAKSGITEPKDLIGKKIGEPFAYGHDAAIWARGIMADEYGVPIDSPTYYAGALDATRGRDFAPFPPPPFMKVVKLQPGQSLDGMLVSGEIDALYSAIAPPSFADRSGRVRRLFPDYERVERDYFRKTGIHPLVHLVALRREFYEANRWVAQNLYQTLKRAKDVCYRELDFQEANMHRHYPTPWLTQHQEENRALLGDDPYPYGIEANRKTLEAFLRYHHEQGLAKRRRDVEELFVPEARVEFARFD